MAGIVLEFRGCIAAVVFGRDAPKIGWRPWLGRSFVSAFTAWRVLAVEEATVVSLFSASTGVQVLDPGASGFAFFDAWGCHRESHEVLNRENGSWAGSPLLCQGKGRLHSNTSRH